MPPARKPKKPKPQAERDHPSREEHDRRIAQVQEWISQGKSKSTVRRLATETWGVQWRTSDRYQARARELILKEADTSRQQLRAESFAFYQSIAEVEAEDTQDRLKARERIDKLFCLDQLDAPGKSGGSGGDSGRSANDVPDSQRLAGRGWNRIVQAANRIAIEVQLLEQEKVDHDRKENSVA